MAAAHFHGFGVARQGPWVTSVNKLPVSDVLDRSLVVELERIPDAERKTEEELWERFEAEHPKLLGALFDALSKAIALKPSLKLSRRPRLADWGEYAAAVYEVMGWGAETFLKDWDDVVKVQNQATLDGSPVAQAIITFMEDKEERSNGSEKPPSNTASADNADTANRFGSSWVNDPMRFYRSNRGRRDGH